MRTPYTPAHTRHVLCVFPRYARSFGTFHHAYPLLGPRVVAFMPPQGLLVVAAYLPASWQVRFVDENTGSASNEDLSWADVVLTSGMHIQRPEIRDLARRAHAHGKPVALGGPAVSASPEDYPEIDLVHIGELGDATDALIAHLDARPDLAPPGHQLRFVTETRLPLSDFPIPAYDLVSLRRYFIASVQYSSGCPYRCEFCDIPALYGRNPRLKTPAQLLEELDRIVAGGAMSVYFVDDNFIANPKAAGELVAALCAWQERNGYPLRFACEATLNIAKNERLLASMRQACFDTVFCGIETPDPTALHALVKDQNLRVPILEAVSRINSFGMEVVSGIILGLDTDTPATAGQVIRFVEASQIPVLTINLLTALPKTPLWQRLEAEGRLDAASGRASNVRFTLGYEKTLAMWRACISAAFDPDALYRRFAHQVGHTFVRRRKVPLDARRRSWRTVLGGLGILARIIWRIGVRGRYRRTFWRSAGPLLRAGRIESLIHIALVSHHLIEFTRECLAGDGEAAFYEAGVRPFVSQGVPPSLEPGR